MDARTSLLRSCTMLVRAISLCIGGRTKLLFSFSPSQLIFPLEAERCAQAIHSSVQMRPRSLRPGENEVKRIESLRLVGAGATHMGPFPSAPWQGFAWVSL